MEPWIETLIGLIWMVVLGPAVGNYATSVVYRLPFGQTPFEKNPYCGDCNSMLQPKDLFPILSWLSTRGKCRYCGVKIRPSYTVIEVVCGIIFCVNYLLFGVSEDFILITTIAVFLVILAGLDYHENKVYTLIWTYVVALGAIYRVLHDGSIYPLVFSTFTMLFIGIVVWRTFVALQKADATQVPKAVWLAVMIGVLIPISDSPVAPPFMPLLAVALLAVFYYGVQRLLFSSQASAIAAALAIYSYYVLYGLALKGIIGIT